MHRCISSSAKRYALLCFIFRVHTLPSSSPSYCRGGVVSCLSAAPRDWTHACVVIIRHKYSWTWSTLLSFWQARVVTLKLQRPVSQNTCFLYMYIYAQYVTYVLYFEKTCLCIWKCCLMFLKAHVCIGPNPQLVFAMFLTGSMLV